MGTLHPARPRDSRAEALQIPPGHSPRAEGPAPSPSPFASGPAGGSSTPRRGGPANPSRGASLARRLPGRARDEAGASQPKAEQGTAAPGTRGPGGALRRGPQLLPLCQCEGLLVPPWATCPWGSAGRGSLPERGGSRARRCPQPLPRKAPAGRGAGPERTPAPSPPSAGLCPPRARRAKRGCVSRPGNYIPQQPPGLFPSVSFGLQPGNLKQKKLSGVPRPLLPRPEPFGGPHSGSAVLAGWLAG